MKTLAIATNNLHKLTELQSILTNFNLLSLNQISFFNQIPETSNTFQGNALIKAETIYNFSNLPTLSDDSGLIVEALNGEPGVYSSRYAGLNATDQQNNQKLLANLKNKTNRKAYFTCILCLYINPLNILYFEGKFNGTISFEPHGTNGFGYDPIFIPNNQTKTLAQLTSSFKNQFSHRALALEKFNNAFLINNELLNG